MKLPDPKLPNLRPLYTAISVNQLLGRPAKEWTIPGVLPASGVATIYGASNVGKTFLTIALLAAIAEGGTFLGFRAKARSVISWAWKAAMALRRGSAPGQCITGGR